MRLEMDKWVKTSRTLNFKYCFREMSLCGSHFSETNLWIKHSSFLGLQCAVIEFARNVLSKLDAHTAEIDPETSDPVVIEMPEHNQGQMGGTMRLGKRETIFRTQNSMMRQLYGNKVGQFFTFKGPFKKYLTLFWHFSDPTSPQKNWVKTEIGDELGTGRLCLLEPNLSLL